MNPQCFINYPNKPDYLVCTNTNDYPANIQYIAKNAKHVIACDGALHWCESHAITPQLVIGDLDSIATEGNQPTHLQLTDQNTSDTEKALLHIQHRTQTSATKASVVIAGLGGGRFDHCLYHLKLIWQFRHSFSSLDWIGAFDHCRLVDQPCIIQGRAGQRISFFAPWGDAQIHLPDAKYQVSNYTLSMRDCCSLSNAFVGSSIHLEITQGIILVCIENP